jgi:hypothetical protein
MAQMILVRVRVWGMPSPMLPWDAKFGFDGGQHADVVMEAHAAGVGPREGMMLARSLRGDRIRVRHGDYVSRTFQTPGVSIPQGRKQGPPWYNLVGSLAKKKLQSKGLGVSAFPGEELGEAFRSAPEVEAGIEAPVDWSYVEDRCSVLGHLTKAAGAYAEVLRSIVHRAPSQSTRMALVDRLGESRLEASQYLDDGVPPASSVEMPQRVAIA